MRRLPASRAIVVLALAVALQWIDMRGAFHLVRVQEGRFAHPLPSAFWSVATPHYRHVVLHPTNICVGSQGIDYRFFAIRAGYSGATINGGHAARIDTEAVAGYCRQFADDLAAGRVADDTLYVLQPSQVPPFLAARPSVACIPVDGFGACFAAATYAAWQDRFDATAHARPTRDELLRFRDALEAHYRDRMRRPSQPVAGTSADRADLMSQYVAYRTTGCDADEAAGLTMNGEAAAVRLCRRPAFEPAPLPPANELQDVRNRMVGWLAARGAAPTATHVDAAGEAIWTHAWLALRREGRSGPDATGEVLARIRAIAP